MKGGANLGVSFPGTPGPGFARGWVGMWGASGASARMGAYHLHRPIRACSSGDGLSFYQAGALPAVKGPLAWVAGTAMGIATCSRMVAA